jgi:hypothetical protein
MKQNIFEKIGLIQKVNPDDRYDVETKKTWKDVVLQLIPLLIIGTIVTLDMIKYYKYGTPLTTLTKISVVMVTITVCLKVLAIFKTLSDIKHQEWED